MRILDTLFRGARERHEDSGDDLVAAEKWREACWFYREALDTIAPDDGKGRDRLERKEAEAARKAFEDLLARSESAAAASEWEEGRARLDEAGAFARTEAQKAALDFRLRWIEERRRFRQPADEGADAGRDDALRFHRALRRLPREEADRILRLGEAGRRGYLALLDGDASEAREHLAREVEASPESVPAREVLARALEALGLHDEAQSELDEALRRDPDRTALILESARFLRDRRNDAAGALRYVEAACFRRPPGPETTALHLERVLLLAETGRLAEARDVIDRLCDVKGLDRGMLLFNRAGILEALGEIDAAVLDLKEAVAGDPSSGMYLERLADVLVRHGGDPADALQCLERALALDAHDFSARRVGAASPNRARLLYKTARIEAALGDLEAAGARADEALIVCSDPAVQEAILNLRRDLREAGSDER